MWRRFVHPSPTATNRMQSPFRFSIFPDHAGKCAKSLVPLAGLAMVLSCHSVFAEEVAAPANSASVIDFKEQAASAEVRQVANWVIESRDNRRMPFVIIDKVNAKVFVFDAHGQLQGADAALLGMTRGDHTPAGIGSKKMSAIPPQDRTTPAGRFLVSLDRDIHGKEVLLIDYDASIALHPVAKGTPAERRAQRLESATSDDNRISFGCINVPARFYETIISPTFTKSTGLVYILPEKSKASEMFGSGIRK